MKGKGNRPGKNDFLVLYLDRIFVLIKKLAYFVFSNCNIISKEYVAMESKKVLYIRASLEINKDPC
jgi:hypothetical protein